MGHFFCLFDVAALMPPAELRRRVDEMIERIKGCRRREGVEEILVPGESSHRKAQRHRKHGIPIGEATLDELKALCEEYNIAFELEPIEAGD